MVFILLLLLFMLLALVVAVLAVEPVALVEVAVAHGVHVVVHGVHPVVVVVHVVGDGLQQADNVSLVLLGTVQQTVDNSVWVPVDWQLQFGGILLGALGDGLLHLDGVLLGVLLAPAGLVGLHLGPHLDHLLLHLPPEGGRGQQDNGEHLHSLRNKKLIFFLIF